MMDSDVVKKEVLVCINKFKFFGADSELWLKGEMKAWLK